MYLNKVFLFGNLTRDPELKSLPSGFQVASFGLATNRRVKKDEKWEEVPEFHNIVVFGKQADTASQYLKKGSSIFLEGRIQTRSWDDKESGKKNYRTEIVVERFQFGPRAGGGGAPQGGGAPRGSGKAAPTGGKAVDEGIAYPVEDINPDDIPF